MAALGFASKEACSMCQADVTLDVIVTIIIITITITIINALSSKLQSSHSCLCARDLSLDM